MCVCVRKIREKLTTFGHAAKQKKNLFKYIKNIYVYSYSKLHN